MNTEQMNRIIEAEKLAEPSPFLEARILHSMESLNEKPSGLFRINGVILKPVLATLLVLLAVFTGFFAGRHNISSQREAAYADRLSTMKTELFISEINDEDKSLELYK